MPEGVAVGSGPVTGGAVHDDPDRPPEPDAGAPRGWTWNRTERKWQPKIRGKILWHDPGGSEPGPAGPDQPAGADEPGPGGERDPAPSWARGDAGDGKPGGRLKFEDVPKQVTDDIAGLVGLVGLPILSVLQQADPYCGMALAEAFGPAVDAALPLICRSERIVRYFSEDKADWLLWGKLAIALAPVGRAVAEHHVFRRVETVTGEDGRRGWQRVTPGEGDHLQPPAGPEYDYAV